MATFEFLKTHTLTHNGECALLGASSDLTVYLEEIYSQDHWITQYSIRFSGELVNKVDEDYGKNTKFTPLIIPPDACRVLPPKHAATLTYTGSRWRGLRALERIDDTAQPLTLQEKMTLTKALDLKIPAPMVLGIAESAVLSEAEIAPDVFIVCRRVRVAYALMSPAKDADGEPYDYDTAVLNLAHLYNSVTKAPPENLLLEALNGLPGVTMNHPIDCLLCGDVLIIADCGGDAARNRVHFWRVLR